MLHPSVLSEKEALRLFEEASAAYPAQVGILRGIQAVVAAMAAAYSPPINQQKSLVSLKTIQELKGLYDKATPGTWKVSGHPKRLASKGANGHPIHIADFRNSDDGVLCSEVHEHLPSLLLEIERLQNLLPEIARLEREACIAEVLSAGFKPNGAPAYEHIAERIRKARK